MHSAQTWGWLFKVTVIMIDYKYVLFVVYKHRTQRTLPGTITLKVEKEHVNIKLIKKWICKYIRCTKKKDIDKVAELK